MGWRQNPSVHSNLGFGVPEVQSHVRRVERMQRMRGGKSLRMRCHAEWEESRQACRVGKDGMPKRTCGSVRRRQVTVTAAAAVVAAGGGCRTARHLRHMTARPAAATLV